MHFSCLKDVKPDMTTLSVSGYVNEYAKFPSVDGASKLTIDLKGVTGLNSVGTRTWLIWVKNNLHDIPTTVIHAPTLFVKMFGEVQGAVGPKVRVDSFFVPYYCDETGERQDVLFTRGHQFDDSGLGKIPEVKDDKGHTLELDVLPNFFNFLKAQP